MIFVLDLPPPIPSSVLELSECIFVVRFCCYCFWDISLCRPRWPSIYDPPASAFLAGITGVCCHKWSLVFLIEHSFGQDCSAGKGVYLYQVVLWLPHAVAACGMCTTPAHPACTHTNSNNQKNIPLFLVISIMKDSILLIWIVLNLNLLYSSHWVHIVFPHIAKTSLRTV